MDLTKNILPDAVIVSGKSYKIHTDHFYWFRFAKILQSKKIYSADVDYLYVDEKPENKQAGFDALFDFYYEKKEVPRVEEDDNNDVRVLDYDIDSDFVYAAFLQCYHIDLIDTPMHWHKVRALLSGLTGTKLNDIMTYRCSDDNKNKEIMRLKRIWELPAVDEESSEALEKFNKIFYGA